MKQDIQKPEKITVSVLKGIILKTSSLPNILLYDRSIEIVCCSEHCHDAYKLRILCFIQRCASETHKQDIGQAKG
jgi:hypothetical protein